MLPDGKKPYIVINDRLMKRLQDEKLIRYTKPKAITNSSKQTASPDKSNEAGIAMEQSLNADRVPGAAYQPQCQ